MRGRRRDQMTSNDANFEVEDSNNYNIRLTSVEHQYEAIKEDGPDVRGFLNYGKGNFYG